MIVKYILANVNVIKLIDLTTLLGYQYRKVINMNRALSPIIKILLTIL